MKGWLNIDIGFRIDRYVFEISFFSSDWALFAKWTPIKGIYALQFGPIVIAFTDHLKLKERMKEYNQQEHD